MAMNRDEILHRLVTGASYIEREDITEAQRQKAMARYNELEEEFWRLDKQEKAYKPPVPGTVQHSLDTIRTMLEQKRKEDKQRRIGSRRPGA